VAAVLTFVGFDAVHGRGTEAGRIVAILGNMTLVTNATRTASPARTHTTRLRGNQRGVDGAVGCSGRVIGSDVADWHGAG
jgi:hypothetical protein